MSQPTSPLTRFIEALAEEDRTTYQEFVRQLADVDCDPKSIQGRFFEWASPISEGLGLGHPGKLWATMKAQAPKRPRQAAVRGRQLSPSVRQLPGICLQLPGNYRQLLVKYR